ncbi:uncharacterized protein TNCV_1190251 [Trichonephila clavipes]|nr:uncharacterized protein TNCV_1190251 [Trichonephila clavipes]
MKIAAKEEVSASGSNEICVSGDGTWKTSGHTLRIGVCSVIGDVTGKVIDVAVLSSYCKVCEKWSTDEEPMHHFCPIGDNSWCKYQKAVSTNSASLLKHKNIGPIAMMDKIKPVIAELSAPKLLKKCVGVNEAIVMFNEGMTERLKIMKALGFKIGHFTVTSTIKANYARIKKADIKSKSYLLKARRASRMRKKPTNESILQN